MLRQLALRAIGRLPAPVVERIKQARQKSATVHTLTSGFSRWARHDAGTVREGPAHGLRLEVGAGKLGYLLGTNERAVQELIAAELSAGDVFYDIGANVGFFTLLAARLVGEQGLVVAFEPVPESAATIRRNVAANNFTNVLVLEQAAFSRAGSATLAVPADQVGALLTSDAPAGTRSITVELVEIDELVRTGAIRPPNVVKIDVEGAEVDVLAGMKDVLPAAVPLVLCELHDTDAAVRELLDELGFEVELVDDGGGVDNPHIAARAGTRSP
jgi:FkbM family methyltransferase